MKFEKVIVETTENRVGILTLNRPENMNTFSSQMAAELTQALLELDSDPSVRVILLRGAGRAFSVGIDVNELEGKTAVEYRQWIEKMELPLVTISKLKKPVIAQLHGVAAANGMGLVAAADLVIAADNARMGLTAINVGLNCVGPVIPIAVQIAKTGFYHSEDMNYEQQFAYMNEAFARLCTTDDAKEGVNAFFEKRNPVWQEK